MAMFVLILAGVIIYSVVQTRRQREAMQALAAETGWRMREVDPYYDHRFNGFQPFGIGSGRQCKWIFEGEVDGSPFTVFQYRYQTHSTDSKGRQQTQNHFFRVGSVQMPVQAPDLTIVPENIFHKIADTFGGEDIDFESDEFSRKYWVKCGDRRFAYDVITPEMMAYLLADTGWRWQWRGDRLLVYRSGGLQPDSVKPMVARLQAFAERVPRHLTA